jgi:hypothetical protein
MHEQARADRRGEHWPDDREAGVRRRFRALFAPTGAGDAVEELIALHGRDLEARVAELREAGDELERREARTRMLHAKIERILREGSAELDMRQLELDARAQELDRRAAALAEAELLVGERRRELGAVELRGAAVGRREEALRLREAEVEARVAELDALAQRLEEVGASLGSVDRADVRDDAHVLLTTGEAYGIIDRDGPAPLPGAAVELEDGTYRCVLLRPSPFPSDLRRCAVVERVAEPPVSDFSPTPAFHGPAAPFEVQVSD